MAALERDPVRAKSARGGADDRRRALHGHAEAVVNRLADAQAEIDALVSGDAGRGGARFVPYGDGALRGGVGGVVPATPPPRRGAPGGR